MTARLVFAALIVCAPPSSARAQAPGKFPPDSLVNVKVIPKNTPVIQVVGMMRNFAGALGVRCQFCHVGQEGMPLAQFDFAKDDKRTKLTARQMMRMVEEINRRVDTLPEHAKLTSHVEVTCATCHRGVSRPMPLEQLIQETAQTAGADSASRVYRALRERYYGRAAYDFGEPTLNIAAFRLGRAGKFDEAFAILRLNEEQFPASSSLAVFRGNISLMRGDTSGAIAAFREAVRRDSTNSEAQGRLRQITRP
jgi:photosynthetic reaction center cytochrome c subunit